MEVPRSDATALFSVRADRSNDHTLNSASAVCQLVIDEMVPSRSFGNGFTSRGVKMNHTDCCRSRLACGCRLSADGSASIVISSACVR